ncbi:hypothetical protein PS718_02078 [Pseudomonas fluorescens]|uniref:Uncharacterized protein n=1 Tax=Pseudomonas fluorescens TaxID=294 RepID=A0A5E7BUI4_PSEFL|nr:hypothetical protein PS718_02078 [Pseudomonas fluorescens]
MRCGVSEAFRLQDLGLLRNPSGRCDDSLNPLTTRFVHAEGEGLFLHDRGEEIRFEEVLKPCLQANVRRLRKPLAIDMGELAYERQ